MMRRSFMFVLLFLFTITSIQNAFGQKIDVYGRPLRSERSRDFDAIHYRIQLRFDEEAKTFWGENTITISPLKDDFTQVYPIFKYFKVG